MDWILFGNVVVVVLCAFALVSPFVAALRSLRRRPASVLAVFAAASLVATIEAQKTNGVNNLPPMPMPPRSLPPAVATVTSEDVVRGWRVESVTTNAAYSFAMPSDASYVGNWHIHGARSSFGNNVVDFNDFSFPLGTNGAAFSSFWYFVDGRIRPMPKDAEHEICAVGVPMSAVPGQSRLWIAEEPDDSRVLTWENFFLNGDTNAPVNAQIRLFANGDFTTCSNGVETVCRRVNPHDWDGDGIINDDDTNPLVWDGDFNGPANVLPTNANINAYCTVGIVATGPDALVTFAGDRPSSYPDPHFIAKSGVTNDVVILIGKTYSVSSDFPIFFVGSSDSETEIVPLRDSSTRVCRPVAITCSGGNPFSMDVQPSNIGGVFSWQPLGCACSISGSGSTFTFNCSQSCTCCGSSAEGTYAYEGYFLFTSTCPCGCYYDGTGPVWTETPVTPPYTNSVSASVSAAFTEPAVIFESAYENKPGEWVPRRSTRTRLNIVADGGLNGAVLTVSTTNLVKLSHLSGPGLPLASVLVPAETSVSYSIVYEGLAESDAQNDIAVIATVAENMTGTVSSNTCSTTSIRLELAAVWEAPENPCTNRHVYGVGEEVFFKVFPQLSSVSLLTTKLDTEDDLSGYELFDGVATNDASVVRTYTCPISKNYHPPIKVRLGDVEYMPLISLVEPQFVVTTGDGWGLNAVGTFYEGNPKCWPPGDVGEATLVTTNYIGPMDVSFRGIAVSELPCVEEDTVTGCFTNGHWRTHTRGAGAGVAYYVSTNNSWFVDASASKTSESNWSPDSTLVWKIPIGWHRKSQGYTDWHGVSEPDYELRWDPETRPLQMEIVYRQSRHIDSEGNFRTDKFGHWTMRSRFCRVTLDGNVIQERHP